MLGRAGGKPIRVASKSIRCRALLERILDRDERFAGLMTFTLPETLWLAEQGFEDLLLAYPTADSGALEELALRSAANPDGAPIVMVDCVEHLDADRVGARRRARRRSGSASTSTPAGGRSAAGSRSGRSARRSTPSSRRSRWRARSSGGRRSSSAALMAYEGQIAGVGDRPPGRRLRGAAIRFMQRRSAAELAERRAAIVAAVGEFAELEIVNGGGTGSLELTAAEEAVTEVTAGSGFYAPALFDHYSRFSLTPAAGFALPIVRKPGAAGGDRARRRLPRLRQRRRRRGCPSPWLPPGLRARRRGGRRRGADAAARRRRRRASRSATASTCATPRPASSASASTPSTWSRAARSSTRSPPTAARARPSSRLRGRGRGVAYSLVKTRPGSSSSRARLELGPARVARRQRRGGLEVALAPVGAAAVVVHDLLDRLEVGPPLHPPVLVDGDVGGVALVRGAEQGVVAGRDPHLDREEDRVAVARAPTRSPAAPPPGPCSRGTPYSISVKRTRRSLAKIAVAAVDGACRPEASRPASRESAGSPAGSALPAAESASSAQFSRTTSLRKAATAAARARRLLGAVALQDQRRVGVGEGEELEVVVGVGALLRRCRGPPRAGAACRPGAG